MQIYRFEDKKPFMEKLEELLKSGFTSRQLEIYLPHPDHEIEELVEEYWPKSKLKFITLAGGLSGCSAGFAFTIFTSLDWPLITSGKPLVSIPPYIVIAFELTILFGALFSLGGFLLLSRLPSFKQIFHPEEYGNEFVIKILREET
ncbi:MAG: DUF3341 domain-containing protein [Calditrichaeota bacterium]|nr:MAG: DUF3341 domain-containing protein [Calditrichota bacterium]